MKNLLVANSYCRRGGICRAAVCMAASCLMSASGLWANEPGGPAGFLQESSRHYASKVTPYYFGPNAFPIPDILYRVSPDLYVEATGNTYVGFRDDLTNDLSLRASIPLWTRRANLTLWLPVMEWYQNTDRSMAVSNIDPEKQDVAKKGSLTGDVYVSMDFQLLEERKNRPDLTLRAVLKTASGGGYELARYYDSAGYFFDAAVSKSWRLFNVPDLSLRVAGQAGFLCWQTGNARQNDAVMYGFLLGIGWKQLSVSGSLGGYCGWEGIACKDKELAHDRPLSIKVDLRYWYRNLGFLARFQHGIVDYPYNQFGLGVAYRFNILTRR